MITIILNQASTAIDPEGNLLALLAKTVNAELRPFCAVAINRCFVAREQYAHIVLRENDCVDIVLPMQGG